MTGTVVDVFIKLNKKTCFSVTQGMLRHLIDTYLQTEILTVQ